MIDPAFVSELSALPRARHQLLPALRLAQARLGHVSDAAVTRIADHLRLTVNDVEGVVTSYPDLARTPGSPRVCRVCTGPACWAAGAPAILAALEAASGSVTLAETSCAFACALAPVVEVDGRLVGRVARPDLTRLLSPHAAPASGHERAEPLRAAARLLVAAGSCGRAVGAADVARALAEEVARQRAPVAVVESACTGMCHAQVQVTLERAGEAPLTWSRVEPAHAGGLVQMARGHEAGAALPQAFSAAGEDAVPFLAGQRRLLTRDLGRVDPVSLDEALARGVYRGLARARSLAPEAVVKEVERAGLTGRGGAYFPVARKWAACRAAPAERRYLVVNAEEGEPGVFKDRHLLEGDPHRLIEGLAIAAHAIGAEHAFVYVNGHASLARARLVAALAEATAHGLVGCTVELRDGAGGYVLGEESALLESLEGRRAMPRVRPPYPVDVGLWDAPTVVNNVETLAAVPLVLAHGAEWFAALGREGATGTKLVCVSGDVARPGLVEVEMGTTLGDVLNGLAGGVPAGRRLQAVLAGGPSGMLVPPDRLDTPLTPRDPDVLLGSGNLVALDDRHPLLDLVRRLTRFNAEESCGKCTPCREGVNRMREILDRIAAGDRRPADRDDLLELSAIAAGASLCGLGQMAPNPVTSALRHFEILGER